MTATLPMKCIICEKPLEPATDDDADSQPYGAGCCEISFHFGATKFDQMDGFGGPTALNDPDSASLAERLASCRLIEFFMCEDCFEKKAALCRGYNVERKTVKTRAV